MKRKKIFLFLGTFLLLSQILWADVITLKNNKELRGRVLKMEDGRILLEIPGGKIWLKFEEVTQIVEETPQDYYFNTAQNLYNLQAFHSALEYYQKSFPYYPHKAREGILLCLLKLGEHFFEERHFEESQKYFYQVLGYSPFHLRAWSYLKRIEKIFLDWNQLVASAQSLEKKKKFSDAAGELEKAQKLRPTQALTLFPSLAQIHIRWASELYQKKEYLSAGKLFQKAMELEPAYLEDYREAMFDCQIFHLKGLVEKRDFERTSQALETLEYFFPLQEKTSYFRALVFHGLGKYVEASRLYFSALGQKPPAEGEINMTELQQEAEKKVLKPLPPSPVQEKKKETPSSSWKELKIWPFVIYYHREEVALRVKKLLLYYHPLIRKKLMLLNALQDFNPSCKVYLHPSKEAFLKQVPHHHLDGYSLVNSPMGKVISVELHTYEGAPFLFSRTIPHHLGHLTLDYIHPHPSHLPLWIREGFALDQESIVVKRSYLRRLKWDFEGKSKIPASLLYEKHFPSTKEEQEKFQTLAFSFYSFFSQVNATTRVLHFLEVAAKNMLDRAFSEVLYITSSEFFVEWLWWAKNEVDREIEK